jgi:hypothetical protein
MQRVREATLGIDWMPLFGCERSAKAACYRKKKFTLPCALGSRLGTRIFGISQALVGHGRIVTGEGNCILGELRVFELFPRIHFLLQIGEALLLGRKPASTRPVIDRRPLSPSPQNPTHQNNQVVKSFHRTPPQSFRHRHFGEPVPVSLPDYTLS